MQQLHKQVVMIICLKMAILLIMRMIHIRGIIQLNTRPNNEPSIASAFDKQLAYDYGVLYVDDNKANPGNTPAQWLDRLNRATLVFIIVQALFCCGWLFDTRVQ